MGLPKVNTLVSELSMIAAVNSKPPIVLFDDVFEVKNVDVQVRHMHTAWILDPLCTTYGLASGAIHNELKAC